MVPPLKIPIPNASLLLQSSHPMTCPSTVIGLDFFSTPPSGSHLIGCRLKKGHGGTTRAIVKTVPPKPIMSASLISCLMKPKIKERPYTNISTLVLSRIKCKWLTPKIESRAVARNSANLCPSKSCEELVWSIWKLEICDEQFGLLRHREPSLVFDLPWYVYVKYGVNGCE